MDLTKIFDQPISERDINRIYNQIKNLPKGEQQEIMGMFDQYEKQEYRKKLQSEFLPFIKKMWPVFIEGWHHRIMAKKFEGILDGSIKRLAIVMPPRMGKSECGSVHFPAMYMGRNPTHKILQVSNNTELATKFGRQVKNLMESGPYAEVFPGVKLAKDSHAAGRWNSNHGGEYFAAGVGSNVAGHGGNLIVIDDPHSEQDDISSGANNIYDKAYEWYTSGPRQRIQRDAAIILIMTRWDLKDLFGQVIKYSGEKWDVVRFPAILPPDEKHPYERSLWPEYWPLEELQKTKVAITGKGNVGKWNSQYMQDPVAEEGAIVKRGDWKLWEYKQPPKCEYTIQSWDTAYTTKTHSDYSACTTWGVFYTMGQNMRFYRIWEGQEIEFDNEKEALIFDKECMNEYGRIPKIPRADDEEGKVANIILIDAWKGKVDFTDLKKIALQLHKEHRPDICVIEAKQSGPMLISEFREAGIPVSDYNPTRGNDKMSRVHKVSDIFHSGFVWLLDYSHLWDVVEEFACFPHGEHDDLVDSSTQALIRFRDGGFVRLSSDEERRDQSARYAGKADYY